MTLTFQSACLIEVHHLTCYLSFTSSSMETKNKPSGSFSSSSWNHSDIFYVSCKFALSDDSLDLFTRLLNSCRSTFVRFSTTIIETIVDENDPSKNESFNLDYLAKWFEHNWLVDQILHFELRSGKSSSSEPFLCFAIISTRFERLILRRIIFVLLSSFCSFLDTTLKHVHDV